MTVPTSLIGIVVALVSNSRLVRRSRPGAQCQLLAPAPERIAKT
jgi:hypothetical protein